MGHDYIFEILLDAYLPERGTTMHPTSPPQSQHAAVHPIDETVTDDTAANQMSHFSIKKKIIINKKVTYLSLKRPSPVAIEVHSLGNAS